jgi:restriction system protein
MITAFGKKNSIPPWEGITWVLDLLPDYPREAIESVDAYLTAHIQFLPDLRMAGLGDAMDIIRAKFIGTPETSLDKIEFLLALPPREVERIVEKLYEKMGYKTQLTRAQKDGGRDVIANRELPGKSEQIRIEVKRYAGPVGSPIVQQILGVVSDEKVNKGVVVTTGYFTKAAKNFALKNPRLELIAGGDLVVLLNEHFGTHWPLYISRIIKQV